MTEQELAAMNAGRAKKTKAPRKTDPSKASTIHDTASEDVLLEAKLSILSDNEATIQRAIADARFEKQALYAQAYAAESKNITGAINSVSSGQLLGYAQKKTAHIPQLASRSAQLQLTGTIEDEVDEIPTYDAPAWLAVLMDGDDE